MRGFTVAAASAAIVIVAAPADAQSGDASFSFQGVYVRPVGDFAEHVRHGGGVDLGFFVPAAVGGALGLRATIGALNYGIDRGETCLSTGWGCRWHQVRTTNEIGYGSIGPQLVVTRGPVRPYATVGAGAAWFSTHTEIGDLFEPEYRAVVNNLSRFTVSWTGGGGVLVPIDAGEYVIMLDLGARYLGNGPVEYLTKGEVGGFPSDRRELNPTRSRASMVLFQAGFSLALN
jgi:opacity protein-like surface antigen